MLPTHAQERKTLRDMAAEAEDVLKLFDTKSGGRGRVAYRLFAGSIFFSICGVCVYRLGFILCLLFPGYFPNPGYCSVYAAGVVGEVTEKGDGSYYYYLLWGSVGMFLAELVFGLYWILSQSIRWKPVDRIPYKDKLSLRYENKLPPVDIFVCTADPEMEPPSLVINTVLSVMSYNYPQENLSIYLSDDGGSEFTFYALLEASEFAKQWIPFCKKYNIEPRSPEAYFASQASVWHAGNGPDFLSIERTYKDMKQRIDDAVKTRSISHEIKKKHKGFSEWNPKVTKSDHQSIVEIIIDGSDENAVDGDGCRLPTLVYLAREKRPDHHHNFKAGSMNALIRVSSVISNAPIILNLDCDMYANNSDAIREALCFFMDEKQGRKIAFVQFPQNFNNITPNDLYFNSCSMVNQVEFKGLDGAGNGTMLYCGTGCFHRRLSLSGMKYTEDYEQNLTEESLGMTRNGRNLPELEEASKVVANMSYEQGTPWGKEMGLMYGCPVEDIVTGISIQCKGWKSIYYNPMQKAFIGVAPNTLELCLVQFKRWSEGMFQIFLSKYCPFTHGRGKIMTEAQMAYSYYLLWVPLCLPSLYYVIVPPLFLLRGIPLFPEVSLSNPWFVPFVYAVLGRIVYSIYEVLGCRLTLKSWCNTQRMLLFRRTSAFPFALVDVILTQLGLSQTGFVVTAKTVTPEVQTRYEKEIIEFGSSSVMFTVIATLAMLNLFCLLGGLAMVIGWGSYGLSRLGRFLGQFLVAGSVVALNLPVYEALLIRHDQGRLPNSVKFKSLVAASTACVVAMCL